jgi:hypothetical protein
LDGRIAYQLYGASSTPGKSVSFLCSLLLALHVTPGTVLLITAICVVALSVRASARSQLPGSARR